MYSERRGFYKLRSNFYLFTHLRFNKKFIMGI